jgi:Uma2 family endonuclease
MSTIAVRGIGPQGSSEPAWDIARLFPDQGQWSDEEYLQLSSGNHLVEFSHGNVEVLAMPTEFHQDLVAVIYELLQAFVLIRKLGKVMFAPRPMRLWPGKFREPDVMFMKAEHSARRRKEFWEGADLVIEVVSDDDRRRDLEVKRREYAKAGISEYWIVDPLQLALSVLRLDGEHYVEAGVFGYGQHSESVILSGFSIDVTAMFEEAKRRSRGSE